MKKYIFALILFVSAFAQAQDTTCTLPWQSYASVTMTGTVDTVDVIFGSQSKKVLNAYMISAVSSATDTITVYTLNEDGSTWNVCGVVGLSTGTTAAFINAITTKNKYKLTDPVPVKIRLVYGSDDGATCAVIVSGVHQPE